MMTTVVSIVISVIPTLLVVGAFVLILRLRSSGHRKCGSCGCTSVPRDPYVMYCPSCGRQLARDAMVSTGHHELESWMLFKRLFAIMLIPFLAVLGGAAWLLMLAMNSWR
jgi:predicted RNA-binding Zn-ribbon protein involved in translation (DUF1610 family)